MMRYVPRRRTRWAATCSSLAAFAICMGAGVAAWVLGQAFYHSDFADHVFEPDPVVEVKPGEGVLLLLGTGCPTDTGAAIGFEEDERVFEGCTHIQGYWAEKEVR